MTSDHAIVLDAATSEADRIHLEAARRLGLSRQQLYRKLAEFDLD